MPTTTFAISLSGGTSKVIASSSPGTLVVTTSSGLSDSADEGGPFSGSQVYTLQNAGTTAIDWTAAKTQTWVSLSAASGTLAAGDSTTVTASINSGANSLDPGGFSDTITFTNTTNDRGSTTRPVSLTVNSTDNYAESVTRNGIVFSFSSARVVGQYVTGDYWVACESGDSSVPISALSRPHATDGYDGAEINPGPSHTAGQGFRTSLHSTEAYDSSLDVSRSFPFTLDAGDSLVATVSWVAGDTGAPSGPRPAIRRAAPLTCVAHGSTPAANAFRPAWADCTKKLYTTDDITYAALAGSALPSLSVPAGTRPDLATVEGWLEQMWLDNHSSNGDGTQYHNPSENMTNYGREHLQRIGIAALYLAMDSGTIGSKTTLLRRMIQLGLDYYGMLESGCKWVCNGGLNYGKKLPILLAGTLLNDSDMLAIGTNYPASGGYFVEDSSTFTVGSDDLTRVLDCMADIAVATVDDATTVTGVVTRPAGATKNATWIDGYVGRLVGCIVYVASGTGAGQYRQITDSSMTRGHKVYNGDSLSITVDTAWSPALDSTSVVRICGYLASQVGSYLNAWQGEADWGITHVANGSNTLTSDNPSLDAEYRYNGLKHCSPYILAAYAFGLKTAWNHDPLFAYCDRFMTAFMGANATTYGTWQDLCWTTHRGSF